MASKPQCGQSTNTSANDSDAKGLLLKRSQADDDDIEFVSANPVKKARHVGPQTSQTPATQQQMSMPPPPLAPSQQQYLAKPQAQVSAPPPPPLPHQVMAPPLGTTHPVMPQLDRCQSLQPNAPTPDMSLDGRGFSAPNFENFSFPPPSQFSPAMSRPARGISEAISPKQLPQSISPKLPRGGTPAPRPTEAPMQPTTSLDQISCLDFHGAPMNFELGKLFSGDMAGPNEFPTNTMTGPPSNSMPAPGFGSMCASNAIPFAMYSTGNFVPMPQPQHHPMGQLNSTPSPMLSTGSGPARAMGTSSQNHHIWDKMKHIPAFGQSRTAGGGFPGGNYPGSAPQRTPPCVLCAKGRQTPHGPSPPPSIGHHNCHTTPWTPGMLNQPAPPFNNNYPFSTPPGNPSMPNQPAPLLHHPNPHPMPPTYRANTPAPTQQSMHRPPPPGLHQGTPSNAAPPTAKPTPTPPPPKKPHAQNLFVDIAETVELVFPYKDVAARHGVTPAKVAEALSGVVMLPLLRCASDKRRAGKLAHDRMREYRDARAAVQGQNGDLRGDGMAGGLREMERYLEGGGQNGGGNVSGGGSGSGNGNGNGNGNRNVNGNGNGNGR